MSGTPPEYPGVMSRDDYFPHLDGSYDAPFGDEVNIYLLEKIILRDIEWKYIVNTPQKISVRNEFFDGLFGQRALSSVYSRSVTFNSSFKLSTLHGSGTVANLSVSFARKEARKFPLNYTVLLILSRTHSISTPRVTQALSISKTFSQQEIEALSSEGPISASFSKSSFSEEVRFGAFEVVMTIIPVT